jgi:exonuclease SbcC
MRLHRLEVQALQAFATTAEVDFDTLSDAGLFLLHGNTGAGKTTLLDAVCFALFGKLPGARGAHARERADLAAADLPTQVVLELTLRGERVRITRSPAQERPKQRGAGTTTVKATVLLEAVAPDGTSRALANRHEEVAHELDRLLGMSREQFCQVVLLPQGQFATFLHAKSDDREELLARLFGTERFEEAERFLTDRRRKAEEATRAAIEDLKDSAARLAQVLQDELPEGWETEPSRLGAWADAAQVLADAELAAAGGVCERAALERTEADGALAGVRELLTRRRRHADARADLAAFEARTPERDEAARVLALARAAAVVQPLLAVADGQARRAVQARAGADAACLALDRAGATPDALRKQAAGHRTAAGEAGALGPLEDELAARAARLREGADQGQELQAQAQTAAAWLDAAEAELARLTARVDRSRLAVAQEDEHDAAAAHAAVRVDAGRRREALATQIRHDAALLVGVADAEHEARRHWLDLRELRLDGMSAELAALLTDDAPCPVCGALEHPEPAAHDIGGQVTAAQEREAGEAADAARAKREGLDAALAAAQAAHAAAVAVAGGTPLPALQAAADVAAAQAQRTADAAADAGSAGAALAEHATARTAAQADRADALQRLGTLQAGLEEARVAQTRDTARLLAALDGAPDVAARVAALEALAVAHEEAAAATDRAVETERAGAEAQVRATEAAHAAGFEDRADAAAAVLDPSALAGREAAVRAHDDGLAERRRLVHDPQLVAAVTEDVPDEAAAMTRAREAAAADAGAGQALERVRGRAEALLALRRELERRLATHGPLAAEAATVRGLAMLVDGTSSQNRKRMRLRAYVLAARLEEIAIAASGRLQAMTYGRYTLAHDDELASHRTRSGLGLRIVDSWTGQDRHPSTLSGGETFLASLALALGLADVVAAEAGGARLQTLFVDEGFGSLDEAALDEVLDVLDRLRDGGRAVGVVSHVPELRQRITAQLHVVKERHGSRIVQTA